MSTQVLTADAMEKSMSAEENRSQSGFGAEGALNHVEKPEKRIEPDIHARFCLFCL